MTTPPEFIRLWVNPISGSRFASGKFGITTETRDFINNMIIRDGNGKPDTKTVKGLTGYKDRELQHHIATYLDNIHLTISTHNINDDHITIAFRDKSRFFVRYNRGQTLEFTTGMEGGMPEPVGGGNAHKLADVIPIVNKTILPLIEKIYTDPGIQHYIRLDSEVPTITPSSQISTGMVATQSQGVDYFDEEKEMDELPEPEPLVRRRSSRLQGRQTSEYDPRRDDRPPTTHRSRSRGKTKKRKKNKKTKKRKNKKQKKTKKKKN